MKNLLAMFAFCVVCASAHAQDELIFAVDVIRHGDRTPIEEIPSDPHHWEEGLGQLTPDGMRQEYDLGSRLRREYVEHSRLLPERYQSGTLYARSTDIERTLISAQCLLLGLYPHGTGPAQGGTPALPDAAQPVPIHTVPTSDDIVRIPSNPHEALMAQYVTSSPQWRQKTSAVQAKFPQWSQVLGLVIKDLGQLQSLGDALLVRRGHHVALPKALSPEDAQEIIDAGRSTLVMEFQPEEMGRITGTPLLSKIGEYLDGTGRPGTALKYVLFSAHDNTLLSLMSAMGAPLDEAPVPASRLNFSVFGSGAQQKYVKVSYNDRAVKVRGCGSDSCTLSQFLALTKR